MGTANSGLAEPPEGALVGESVPRENEEDDRHEQEIEELVGLMKGHPAYSDLSETEIEEAARRKVKHIHG